MWQLPLYIKSSQSTYVRRQNYDGENQEKLAECKREDIGGVRDSRTPNINPYHVFNSSYIISE